MQLRTTLESATSASARAAALRAYAEEWRVSIATARRHAGWRGGRAPRPARGYPVPKETLDQVVALWLASATEKYDTATMPLADVLDLCESAGLLEAGQLSRAQLRRYIREQAITLADQRRGAPHIHLASPHPNWAHQVDTTRCRQWYLKPDGRLDLQSFQRGTAEYRNRDLRGLPLYRYVLVDHTSGLPYVQYATDETVPTLLAFLASAWLPKRQRRVAGPTGDERWAPAPFVPAEAEAWAALPALRDYHFRGVPHVLVVDRAGQNQSEFVRQLCQRLGVRHLLAQEARAKGAVECMMWIWERKFEARLAVRPAADLATLNVWALDFLQHWCLTAVHSRHGLTRSQAWARILPEQLRELPAWPIFQELARRAPEPRTVKSGEAGAGLIYHEGRAWRVPDAGLIGQVVQVSYAVFHPDTLEARTADGRALICEAVPRDRWGFLASAPVLGERFASHPESRTEQTDKRLAAVRSALPPLEVFGREGSRERPALLPPPQGVEIPLALPAGARELGRSECNKRVIAALERAFTEAEGAERDRRFQGRTTWTEAELDAFIAWCQTQAPTAAAASPKVVNLFR